MYLSLQLTLTLNKTMSCLARLGKREKGNKTSCVISIVWTRLKSTTERYLLVLPSSSSRSALRLASSFLKALLYCTLFDYYYSTTLY